MTTEPPKSFTVYTVREVDPHKEHSNHFHTVKGCRGAEKPLEVIPDPRWPNFMAVPVLPDGRFGTHSLHKCWLCRKAEIAQEGVSYDALVRRRSHYPSI